MMDGMIGIRACSIEDVGPGMIYPLLCSFSKMERVVCFPSSARFRKAQALAELHREVYVKALATVGTSPCCPAGLLTDGASDWVSGVVTLRPTKAGLRLNTALGAGNGSVTFDTTSLNSKESCKSCSSRAIARGHGRHLETEQIKLQKGTKHTTPRLLLPTMNRPSRTEDDLEHPTWNQNPPFLAADLTTCEDLNGIANSREHRNGCSGTGNGVGYLDDEKHAGDIRVCECDRNSVTCPPSAMSCRRNRKCRVALHSFARPVECRAKTPKQARSLPPGQRLVVKAKPVRPSAQSGPVWAGLAGSRRSLSCRR